MRLVCKSKHRNVPRLWADIFIQLLILLGRVTVRRLLSARINCRKEKQDKVAALNRIRLWKSSGSWTVVFFSFFPLFPSFILKYYDVMLCADGTAAFTVRHLEDVRVRVRRAVGLSFESSGATTLSDSVGLCGNLHAGCCVLNAALKVHE